MTVMVSDSGRTLVVLVALALKDCVLGGAGAAIHQLIEGECIVGCVRCGALLLLELNLKLLSFHKNLLICGQTVLICLLACGAQTMQGSV